MGKLIVSREKQFLESGKDNFFTMNPDDVELKVFKGLYEYLHDMEELSDVDEINATKTILCQYHEWHEERFNKPHWSFPFFQSHYNLDHCIERFGLSVI